MCIRDSYDAVGEFINCIDGLFSSALSNENIDIEILPQFAYENQIAKGNAYVLPIYINGCEVSLYIAVDSDVTIGQMPVTRKLAVKAGSVDEGDKHTVLIVDDSGMSRMMLRNILEDAGSVSYTHLDVYKRQVKKNKSRLYTGIFIWKALSGK